jgi:hypothetical protein
MRSRSHYFDGLFAESTRDADGRIRVDMPAISSELLLPLIKCIYSASVSPVIRDIQSAVNQIHPQSEYKLKALKEEWKLRLSELCRVAKSLSLDVVAQNLRELKSFDISQLPSPVRWSVPDRISF